MDETKNASNSDIQLPPGFRFHPTDEELIVHYLQNKVASTTLPASIFAEIELYKFDPWELPYKALFGEEEWYFFSPRDRKYPNGVRPNRMAGSGYWKATGTDRPILGSCSKKIVGVKKALVFYKGRPPRGDKTDWIMHEYRLLDCRSNKPKESMRLDDWVLCRVRQKICTPRNFYEDRYGQPEQEKSTVNPKNVTSNIQILKNDTLFKDCPMLPFILDSHLDFSSIDTLSSAISFSGSKNSFDSPKNRGRFQESFQGSISYARKHKEQSQDKGYVKSNKKFRVMEDQSDKEESLKVDTNDMSSYSGDQSEIWKYMMTYEDINNLACM